jgi:O-antigen ligase
MVAMSTSESLGRVAVFPAASLLGGWFVYLLVAPTWGFFWIDAWHNEQRAVQVILLVATGVCAVSIARFRVVLVPRSSAAYLVWAIALLGAVSAARASFVAPALAELSLHLLLVVLAAFTAVSVRQDPVRFSVWIRRGCLVLAGIHVAGVAARYAAMLTLERAPDLDVLLLGYSNPRFPTALYALLMPFVAVLAVDPGEKMTLRRLGGVVLVLLWCINIALGTRAIWFAYALTLPLLVVLVGWRRVLPGALALGSSALGGFLVYYLFFVAIPAWLALGSGLPSHVDHLTSFSDRIYLWTQSLRVIIGAPLLGIGPMNLAGLGDSFASHPHNWMLQVAAEWGVPALALLCLVLWRLGRQLRLKVRVERGNDADVLAPLAATTIGLCYGLVDGNLVMPVSQTAFALTLGILLGNAFATAPTSTSGRRSLSPLVATLVLASASCLIVYVLDTLPKQGENESAWRRTSKYSDNLAPRFWQQGLLR